MCQGSLVRVVTGHHVYLNLCYAMATLGKANELKATVEEIEAMMNHMDYRFINMNVFREVME